MTPEQQQRAEAYLQMLRELQATADRFMVSPFQVALHLGEARSPIVGPEAAERNRQAVEPHERKLAWLAQQGRVERVNLPDHLREPGLHCYRVVC